MTESGREQTRDWQDCDYLRAFAPPTGKIDAAFFVTGRQAFALTGVRSPAWTTVS